MEIIKMDYNIMISMEAQKDANAANCYYENQQTGSGDRFVDAVSLVHPGLKQHRPYYCFALENITTRPVVLRIFPLSSSVKMMSKKCMHMLFGIFIKIRANFTKYFKK